jgi:hypothetical protein
VICGGGAGLLGMRGGEGAGLRRWRGGGQLEAAAALRTAALERGRARF